MLFIAAIVGLALAGCGSAGSSGRPGMMNGSGAVSSTAGGIAGAPNYHFRRLTCSAPPSLGGRIVNVTLADMGMTRMMAGAAPIGAHMMLRAAPDSVPAGLITVVASNMGWRTHELVILPLAAGAVAGQRSAGPDGKVAEAGSLGEASSSCAGGPGGGIPAGTVSWITVTLTPGHYELICNLPNHYADGMYQQLNVT